MKAYLFPLFALAMIACQKEEKLTASTYENAYTLPQGNTATDDTIMAIHQQYGTYVLYRFTQDDYAYNFTFKLKDSAFSANPAYVDTALQFFRQQLMMYYPESFLRKTMPFKLLLASYIGSADRRSATGFASNVSTLTMGWADSTMLHKTPEEIKHLRSELHHYYWERAYRAGIIKIPVAFSELSPLYAYVNIYNRYSQGVVSDVYLTDLTVGEDFLAYVELIAGSSVAELESGLFLPQNDTKGLIRKKYNIVNDYCKNEYGVDLQAIGQVP